jgi:hypothetical protein
MRLRVLDSRMVHRDDPLTTYAGDLEMGQASCGLACFLKGHKGEGCGNRGKEAISRVGYEKERVAPSPLSGGKGVWT